MGRTRVTSVVARLIGGFLIAFCFLWTRTGAVGFKPTVDVVVLPPGIVNSLLQKLDNAAAQRAAERCDSSGGMYHAFINDLTAQAGKQISAAAAQVIIGDPQYLMAHCP
jgi:hypothetical protein